MNKPRFAAHGRQMLAMQIMAMLAAAPLAVYAQTPPSSGTIFDTNRPQLTPADRDRLQQPQQQPRRSVQIEKETEDADDAATPTQQAGQAVTVSRFTLSGNTVIDDAALQDALHEFVGQELDFNGLRRAAARITALYRARGYMVARAYLPAQEIRDGHVAIAVREGVVGQVVADADNSVRLNKAVLQRYLDEIEPGSVIRESKLEATLLRLSDIAGVSVHAVLRPASHSGATDIVIHLTEMTAITSRIAFDNYGNYYTGSNRLTTNINLNDALGLGETFGITAQNAFEGLHIYGVNFAMPVGSSGLSFGASAAQLQYNVGKSLKDAQASGSATVSSFFVNDALYRSRQANVNLSLAAESRHFEDITSATAVRKSARFYSATLYGDWRDSLFGAPAANSWNLRYGRGQLDKETPNDATLDTITAQAAGNYSKTNAAFSRLQQLGGGFSVLASVNAQFANRNLDASEKMSLGGPNGVRAYPVGEAAGDEGVLGRLELRKQFGRFDQLGGAIVEGTLFADAGRVTINKTPWNPTEENHTSRYGYGAGVNVYHKDLVFNASLAFSPGVAPVTEDRSPRRLWVSVSGSPQAFAGLGSDSAGKGEDFEEPETGLVLYGSLGLIPEFVHRDGATPAAPADQSKLATPNGRNMPGFWRVRDNVSYIGAHGGYELYDQWKLLWQLEMGLSLNYTNRSAEAVPDWDHSQDLRNTAVAVQNPRVGTFMYGNWDTPMKESTTPFDPFQSLTSAAHYNIIGSPGFVTSITKNSGPVGDALTSNNDDAAFNRRQNGMISYWSPKLYGFQLKVAYSNNGMKAAPDVATGYLYSGSLGYERGGFSAVVSAETHVNYFGIASLGRDARGVGSSTHVTAGTSSNDLSVRYGIAYDFGKTKVSLIADDLSYSEYGVMNTSVTSTDMSNYRRRAYMVGLTHQIGALELRASAGKALAGDCSMISGNNVQCSTDGMGATSQAVGFSYRWSKQTRFFGQYVVLRNQALANYNFAVSGVLGATGLSPGVGTTIRALGLGVNYTF